MNLHALSLPTLLAVCGLAALSGCVPHSVTHATRAVRLPWVSVDDTLGRIAALPAPDAPGAPCAVYLLFPEDLEADAQTKLRGALASRGYQGMHTCPEMITEVTPYEVMLALADPVEVLCFHAHQLAAATVELWQHEIPYAVTLGNYAGVIVPRRLVPQVRALLASVVPAGAWLSPREIRKPSNKTE